MTLPTYKIEIAFNAGVTTPAASRTWTDVTSYVLLSDGIDITYGRGDWRSEADANTLRLTLNNSDGRFTAGRSASPYYPNVKLGRPIRVTATVGGVPSVRFVGFVDEWPLEWPAAVTTFATAQITASSRMAWLAEDVELRSIIEEEYLVDGPPAYYTLGEPAGATSAGDSSGNAGAPLTIIGGGTPVTFGAATGPTTDGLTAAQFGAGQYLRMARGLPNAVEMFFGTSATPASNAYLWQAVLFVVGGPSSTTLDLHVDTAGKLHGIAPGSVDISTSSVVNDGAIHHAAFVASGSLVSPTWTLYLDGVSVGSAAGGSLLSNFASVNWIGPNFSGVIAQAAVAGFGLSGSRVAAHATAGLNGFAGETPAARLTRYASYADIAATELALDTGQVPGLTHLDTTGTPALDMMRKIEATEEGILFDKADGTLAFHDRAHRYSATAAFVLSVPQGQVGTGMEPRLDRTTIRNDVSATSTDGTLTARVTNQTSIGSYGLARESLDLATSNADEPFEHVSWLVNQYAEPQPRVPSLTVDLANTNVGTALSQSVLAAAVSTQFTVTGMPSQAASSSQDYIVEGYSESIGDSRHQITFNISQAQPYQVFTIGDPVFGQYDAYPIAL